MDGVFGIELLMRTPNRDRPHLALEGLRTYFDRDAVSGTPESSDRALDLARAQLAELRANPDLLARAEPSAGLFRQHWLEGRGEPVLTAALERVKIGELLPEPVRSPNSFVVGRRIEPPPLEPAEVWLELPSPAEPDIPAHIGRLRPDVVREELKRVSDDLRQQGALDEASVAALQELVGQYPAAQEGAVPSYRKLDGDVQRVLGSDRYEQYRRALHRHFEALLLAPRKPRG